MIIRQTIKLCVLLILLGGMAHSHPGPTQKITVPGAGSADLDASNGYALGLLKLAVSKSSPHNQAPKIVYGPNMTQARALKQIELGKTIDIFWAGTSIEREQQLKAIRIPLLKGLLGYRVSLVHKDFISGFDGINSKQDFTRFSPCQGSDWPDTDILASGGFNVVRNPDYKMMFKQVSIKRCHFLPLGVYEADAEYTANKNLYPNIRLYKDIIIRYPFPMYFFVNKDNTTLASLIKNGLEKAIDDGSFDDYMKKSEVTKHLFPIKNWINARYINLSNPLLPKDTDTSNPRYWVQNDSRI